MIRLKNIFNEICSFETLHEAYLKARKGKRNHEEVIKYSMNLEENLIRLQNKLLNGTYKVGRYRKFYVYEPKKRLIMALPFEDRIVQWAIYIVLYPIYDRRYINDSYGCRVDKGMHRAARRVQYWEKLLNNKKQQDIYYLKLDVSKYFYRVSHNVINNILNHDIKDKKAVELIMTFVDSKTEPFGVPKQYNPTECPVNKMLYDVGMPIGSLLSQLLANIYLNILDQHVKHELKVRYYIRYMDDMIIISNDKSKLHIVKAKIEKYLNEVLQLDLNNKTCIRQITQGVDFVGCRIYSTHIKIRKKTVLRIRKYLKIIKQKYSSGAITLDKVKSTVQSYLGLLRQFNTYSLSITIFDNFVLTRKNKGIKGEDNG